jgi:glycosyltransferase involved in cell wall biosynthesis
MIKVCHLSSVHQPYDVRIFHKECLSLVANGFEVHYVVSDNIENPTIETKNGVIIHRIKKNDSRFFRITKTVNEVYKEAKKIDADIYHLHDSELLRVGNKLLKKNKKVIYDIHEDLPRQILSKPYIPKIFRSVFSSVIEFFENYYAKKMSALVAAWPLIFERFIKLNPLTIELDNYPKLSEFNFENSIGEKQNEICYIGGITEIRGIFEVMKAMEKTTTKLNLAGDVESQSLKIKTMPGWKNINYFGFVNRDEVVRILNRSKAGLVTFHPEKNHVNAIPNKMFEYAAAGIPVIASDFPFWKSIIEKYRFGICVNPFQPDEISDAINYLLSHPQQAKEMGLRGRKAVEENFNWEHEEKKLIALYKKLSE